MDRNAPRSAPAGGSLASSVADARVRLSRGHAAKAPQPRTLEQAALRSLDLLFANQTARALSAFERRESFAGAAVAEDERR
jgi:hypothetical protein